MECRSVLCRGVEDGRGLTSAPRPVRDRGVDPAILCECDEVRKAGFLDIQLLM